jgi:hypothetical protein
VVLECIDIGDNLDHEEKMFCVICLKLHLFNHMSLV